MKKKTKKQFHIYIVIMWDPKWMGHIVSSCHFETYERLEVIVPHAARANNIYNNIITTVFFQITKIYIIEKWKKRRWNYKNKKRKTRKKEKELHFCIILYYVFFKCCCFVMYIIRFQCPSITIHNFYSGTFILKCVMFFFFIK